ncbi:MAG: hypothetical protein H6680_00860 [Desulfobacteraceae bacterium]|nr:hypothetical protein [Desulfobacteraceae bacterium]
MVLLKILLVTQENINVYHNLAQSYEGEFSVLTKKRPNSIGLFELDTLISPPVKGYILYIEESPAGIAAIKEKDNNEFEVCEFYVVPSFRRTSWGTKFAHSLWQNNPGKWEIKQIQGAEYASEFWRKAICDSGISYDEDKYDDPYWGVVTRQKFKVKNLFNKQ